jgi:hypothetical protein
MQTNEVNTPVVTGDEDTDALLEMERIDQELPENQVALHSVGSVLDTEIAVLYPMFKEGNADYDNPCCLEDVDKEWYADLSKADHLTAHNTMLSFSSAPPNDVVLLKRMLEESYLMIKLMQQSKEEYGTWREHILDESNSLLQRLDRITKVGTKAKEIERWTS